MRRVHKDTQPTLSTLTSRITSIKSRLSPKHKKAFYGVRYRISDGNSTSERIVELMRLPMGVTFAPAVVQHITDAIICTYHEAQRLPSVQHEDNIRIAPLFRGEGAAPAGGGGPASPRNGANAALQCVGHERKRRREASLGRRSSGLSAGRPLKR